MVENRDRFEREFHPLRWYGFQRLLVVGSESGILVGSYQIEIELESEGKRRAAAGWSVWKHRGTGTCPPDASDREKAPIRKDASFGRGSLAAAKPKARRIRSGTFRQVNK